MAIEARVIQGDALDVLRGMPDESVNCVVTSPPYWNLRHYGVEGEIGRESTIAEYVGRMVEVFGEVRRVLRKDGTCWLNLGDSYARQAGDDSKRDPARMMGGQATCLRNGGIKPGNNRPPEGLKPKDRCMIPARVALALQSDGWWLRDEIIWHKPAPMPMSRLDATTPAHEMIYLLTCSAKYWSDFGTIATPLQDISVRRLNQPNYDFQEGSHRVHAMAIKGKRMKAANGRIDKQAGVSRRYDGFNERYDEGEAEGTSPATAHPRSVWTMSTAGFREAHFATFPEELPKRCILAGCPPGGTVLDPFAGSGTTLAVALALGRNAVGIELNEDYCALARKRIAGVTPAMEGLV